MDITSWNGIDGNPLLSDAGRATALRTRRHRFAFKPAGSDQADPSLEQIEGLRANRIDLGFVRLPVEDDALETLPVIEDRLMLAAGHSKDLPARLSLAECRSLPFVLISRERSPSMRQHVLRLCAKHGFHPRIVQEVPEVTTVLALVRVGLGVSLFSQSFGIARMAGVRFYALDDAEASWSVGAAWRRDDPNPILVRFLEMIRPEAKKRRVN